MYSNTDPHTAWQQFCKTGSIADYLQYRNACQHSKGVCHDNASDRQGRSHS